MWTKDTPIVPGWDWYRVAGINHPLAEDILAL